MNPASSFPPRSPQLGLLPLLFLASSAVIAASSNYVHLLPGVGAARFMIYLSVLLYWWHVRGSVNPPIVGIGAMALALGVLAVTSSLWSTVPSLTLQRAIALLLLVLAAWLLAQRGITDLARLRSVVVALAAPVVVTLLLGILIGLTGAAASYQENTLTLARRFNGVMVSPNSIGVLVAIFLPLMAALWRSSTGLGGRSWWSIGVGAGIISLALAQSRGGAVALIAGIAVFVLRDRSLPKPRLVASVMAVGVAVVCVFVAAPSLQPGFVVEFQERLTGQAVNSAGGSGRTAAWNLAVDIWKDRPLAGWGFGSAEAVFGPRSFEIDQVFQGLNPHNTYFNTLLELGPLAVALLLTIVAYGVGVSLSLRDSVGAGLAGALVALTVVSMFESGLTSAGSIMGFMFWTLVFLAFRARHLERRR